MEELQSLTPLEVIVMSYLPSKKQIIAIAFAFTAVCFFAYFEHELSDFIKKISINEYIAFRLVFTGGLYFLILCLLTAIKKETSTLFFNPCHIDRVLFVRGFFTVFYWACLAAAFAHTKSQALTYPFFFLHPLWQIVASRFVRKTWPPVKNQIVPIILILSGVIMFAAFNPTNIQVSLERQQLLKALSSYFPALLAGAGFAYTNELSSEIHLKCKEHPYKFMGKMTVNNISSLRVSAYTTYAAILLLPILLPAMIISLDYFDMNNSMEIFQTPQALGSHIGILSLACLIVGLGTWAITEAFARAEHTTQIAAFDGLIVPIGAAFDLWHGKLPIHHPNFIWMLGALALIMAGAICSAFQPKPE